jgi:uncharacterized protein (DUF488 family)
VRLCNSPAVQLNSVHTIGHSTRPLEEFLALLAEHGITRLADVRRYPGSRRHPHFSKEALMEVLPGYVHFEDLGGRRRPAKNSRNAWFENEQFRGYADYMATPEFDAAVQRLLATDQPTAVMCAEAVPWRCHRNLLADDLVRRGIDVIHILAPGKSQPHVMNKAARVEGNRLVYAGEQRALDFGEL